MVTLNKPSAGDTNWTTPINDNWTAIEGTIDQAICEGRLTLLSGNTAPYNPLARTPSSTDTVQDTVDFSSPHGWTTGTSVSPEATVGGLTKGTIYYVRAVDSDTVSFHTTVANAESGASKVDLTANITTEIQAFGIASTTLYFTPYKGNRIGLYSGSTWNVRSFSEISLSLSGLTSGKNYDVFVFDNSGTAALELSAAWTNDTTRADTLTTQSGIRVKNSDMTRRYVGTIRAIAANATEDGRTKRLVMNYYNRAKKWLFVCPGYVNDNAVTTYITTSTIFTPANGGTDSKLEFISNGEDETPYSAVISASHVKDGLLNTGVGEDSTTSSMITSLIQAYTTGASMAGALSHRTLFSEGYHHLNLLICVNLGTGTWRADLARNGGSSPDPYGTTISAEVMA